MHVLGRDQNAAAFGHGVAGIDREIDQREFELRLVDADRPGRVRHLDPEFDIDVHRAGQHVVDGVHRLGRIDHRRVERQRARERQQLPRQVLAARRRHFDRRQGACVPAFLSGGFSGSARGR